VAGISGTGKAGVRDDVYGIVRSAVESRRPISCEYHNLPRLFCPHRLGRNKDGQSRVLCYQYGGESESGPQPPLSPANWRCIALDRLSLVKLLNDRWHTAPNHSGASLLHSRSGCQRGRLSGTRSTAGTLGSSPIRWRAMMIRIVAIECGLCRSGRTRGAARPEALPNMPDQAPAKGKSKEEMLREEVRFYADMQQKYMQWGLTLLISLQTAIFFVRHDLIQQYVDSGVLKKGEELPYYRYLVGTVFIALCSYVLWRLTNRVNAQYRHYKDQLVKNNTSGSAIILRSACPAG
jgi:hypothetical protein